MKTLSFLAIDLGTQSMRMSVVDSLGNRLLRWSRPVESTITGDIFEQSPRQWRELLLEGLEEVGRAGIQPDALAVAAPLAGYIALDQDGEPLTPAVMYADRRSAPYLNQVEAAVASVPDANPHGLRAYVPDPLPNFLRLREQTPEICTRTHRLLDATGWINCFLTGRHTLNSYTALRLYNPAVRKILDIPADIFGKPVAIGAPIGNLRPDLGQNLGLSPMPVIAATFDSKSAYIGSGIHRPGDALDISGTVTSFGVVTAEPFKDPEKRVYAVPFEADTFLGRGSNASSGGTLEWARRELLLQDFDAIDRAVETTRAQADAPIFLPYLAGERTPLWNPDARGALLGLSLGASNHARIARAVYEGLSFSLRHIVEVLASQGAHTSKIFLAGGLARNDTLCQIKADILGMPLVRQQDTELTTVGLCTLCGMALGAWPDRSHASGIYTKTERTFFPDMSEHAIHNINFRRYLAFSSALAPTFRPTEGTGA